MFSHKGFFLTTILKIRAVRSNAEIPKLCVLTLRVRVILKPAGTAYGLIYDKRHIAAFFFNDETSPAISAGCRSIAMTHKAQRETDFFAIRHQ